MLNFEQAKQILDQITGNAQMTRQDHALAVQALGLLYEGAKENQESRQAANVVPIRPEVVEGASAKIIPMKAD